MGLFNPKRNAINSLVNEHGDKLSDLSDSERDMLNPTGGMVGDHPNGVGELDPAKRGEMLFNWLTGGGLPKHVDPSTIFAEGQAMAGTNEQAGMGQGFYGLFGFGNKIGDLKADVPYSQPAMPKLGGK